MEDAVEDPPTAEILRTFIVDEVLDGPAAGLTMETPLLEWGLLTSLSTIRLLSFIAERFGVRVPEDEVVGRNLKDLNSIAGMVNRLRSETASDGPAHK
jgi:acyl carrier protein